MSATLRDGEGRFVSGSHWRRERPYWSAEWCRREYVAKRRSCAEIAAEFGVTDVAIGYWLRKHGIRRRSITEARAVGSGTVGVVCAWHGRDFVGIELNPEYAEMARRRIATDGVLGRRAYRPEPPGAGQLGLL